MAAKGYTNKTAIENYMLIDIDASFDDQIDEWIETVEEYIDDETSRDFEEYDDDGAPAATDRTFDGQGDKTLPIDGCIEVEEVRFSETGTAIDADQYVTTPIRKPTITGIKMKYLTFPEGIQNIYVKAKWGYADIPKDIKFAATVLVAGIINNAWQSEGEIQSVTIGRYQVSYKDEKQLQDFNKVEEILQYKKKFTF